MKTTSGSKNVSNSGNAAKDMFSMSETFGGFGTLLSYEQESGRRK
jgi:hypothetical protein